MTEQVTELQLPISVPDHTELPESDGTFANNFQAHPQSILLTDSIEPVLKKCHPEGDYIIGQANGIYWRWTDPLERGAVSPDWFYVPNVPPSLNGKFRRSYVWWQEYLAPLIVLEFVSGDGLEERDGTSVFLSEPEGRAKPGKFWVYETALSVPFYGIYEVSRPGVEVYSLVDGRYRLMPANERGHYPIEPLGVELGLWQGEYQNVNLSWLRWWDAEGNLLLTGWESVKLVEVRLEAERQKAERLAAQLRAAGIEPEV